MTRESWLSRRALPASLNPKNRVLTPLPARVCVCMTPSPVPPSSRPSPCSYPGPREPYLRASLLQYRSALIGTGRGGVSPLPPFHGCEGLLGPGTDSGSFLPSLPTPRVQGTEAAPGRAQMRAGHGSSRGRGEAVAAFLHLSVTPTRPFPVRGRGNRSFGQRRAAPLQAALFPAPRSCLLPFNAGRLRPHREAA